MLGCASAQPSLAASGVKPGGQRRPVRAERSEPRSGAFTDGRSAAACVPNACTFSRTRKNADLQQRRGHPALRRLLSTPGNSTTATNAGWFLHLRGTRASRGRLLSRSGRSPIDDAYGDIAIAPTRVLARLGSLSSSPRSSRLRSADACSLRASDLVKAEVRSDVELGCCVGLRAGVMAIHS